MSDPLPADGVHRHPAPGKPGVNWSAVTYNASIAAGVSLISVGAGFRWGWPIGAIAAGALIIGLTLFAVLISRLGG